MGPKGEKGLPGNPGPRVMICYYTDIHLLYILKFVSTFFWSGPKLFSKPGSTFFFLIGFHFFPGLNQHSFWTEIIDFARFLFFPLWIKTNSCTEPHFSRIHISQVERSRNWSSDYFRVKRGRSVPRGQWGRRETRATMDTTGSPASPDQRENRAVKGHNHTKHYDTKTTF